jgi:hypothetical protein
MTDPAAFDDPVAPSGVRRALTVVVLLLLIVSMVFLAFVSGRGVIEVDPGSQPRPTVIPATPNA